MGRDKALLPYRGGALAAAVARAVKSAFGSATLVGDPRRYGTLGYPVVADRYPGEGPLGGLITALANSTAEWNLVVACDMPEVGPEFLAQLAVAAEAANPEISAVVPVGPGGRPQPLCAVYRRNCLGPFEAAFASGIRKVMAAAAEVRTARLPVAELSPFQNVNTPQDWERYAAG
jgi:molybdopterin-guanine dinucleotide biosynthesis protein A